MDAEAGISLNGVIKIYREVEVREIRVSNNDKSKALWVSTNQPSPGAGLTNDPAAWFIHSGFKKAQTVTLGAYTLSDSLIESLPCN